MKECKYPAGYKGKDSMRSSAERLLKNDLGKEVVGGYPSISAPQNLKMRPYKKGGPVPRSKAGRVSEIGVTPAKKPKNVKRGLQITNQEGFLPQKLKKGGSLKEIHPKPIIAGNHPMIGMNKKSLKLAGATKMKVKKGVKAKHSQPYDASMGTCMRRGGKVKK